MKLGSITKIGKGNTTTPKNFSDNVISENCDAIVFFLIHGYFAAIWKPNSGHMIYRTYIFINNNLLSKKPENRTKISQTQLSYYCFE